MSMTWRGEPVWTVPNVISGLRLLGLAPLLWTAHEGHRQAFLWIMLALLLSDWLDGKLAMLLDHDTVLGARLDSVTDILLYTAIALSLWWLETGVILRTLPWIVAAAATWGVSALVALVRFGSLPSYHTWGAKSCWLVGGIALVLLLAAGNAAAIPWALGLLTLVNLEATAIGFVLPEWRANVPTVVHAMGIRRGGHG